MMNPESGTAVCRGQAMITLNDYLYDGHTLLKILRDYAEDLRNDAKRTHNQADLVHSNFLVQISELLEHNDFLTFQSQRIRELYKYMARVYPFLSFTFKGRIKSLIRAEEKFNGRLLGSVYDYYGEHGVFPAFSEIRNQLLFRDLIAYRVVISLPKCHLRPGENRKELELVYLYELADVIPEFLEERGFSVELSSERISKRLTPEAQPYYKDYIEFPNTFGYQSLHITVYDNSSRSHFELQLRTKEMDDAAEIGLANHLGYEKRQEKERAKRAEIPQGSCVWFDEAYERVMKLQSLDLSRVDVDMFAAVNNLVINDGCGLYRGRQITPFEHLSRFQNDLVD